jgi:hypothetical protein
MVYFNNQTHRISQAKTKLPLPPGIWYNKKTYQENRAAGRFKGLRGLGKPFSVWLSNPGLRSVERAARLAVSNLARLKIEPRSAI